jgi:hypothetical protein
MHMAVRIGGTSCVACLLAARTLDVPYKLCFCATLPNLVGTNNCVSRRTTRVDWVLGMSCTASGFVSEDVDCGSFMHHSLAVSYMTMCGLGMVTSKCSVHMWGQL